jgi:uncharacterized protein (DUF1330 family)
MKQFRIFLPLAVLVGVWIGVAAAGVIHAQQVKTPPGYIIAEVEVTDPAALQKYGAQAPGIVTAYNGHYVIRGGKPQVLEGEAPKGFIVVIGFDSVEKARAWYDSPEYTAIRSIRQNATKSRLLLAEGVAPNAEITPAPQAQPAPPPPTIASVLDFQINGIEKRLMDVAEAMPEEKYNFSPESLKIPGSDYKGVRTFAVQLKHVAASNYFLWSPVTGDKIPEDIKDGNGPESVKTKADILKFLKASFALGHKAAASLTAENMLQPAVNSKSTRLHMATFAIAHANDHYGQMVEYLRMNGIIPPASRPPSN